MSMTSNNNNNSEIYHLKKGDEIKEPEYKEVVNSEGDGPHTILENSFEDERNNTKTDRKKLLKWLKETQAKRDENNRQIFSRWIQKMQVLHNNNMNYQFSVEPCEMSYPQNSYSNSMVLISSNGSLCLPTFFMPVYNGEENTATPMLTNECTKYQTNDESKNNAVSRMPFQLFSPYVPVSPNGAIDSVMPQPQTAYFSYPSYMYEVPQNQVVYKTDTYGVQQTEEKPSATVECSVSSPVG